LDGGGPSKPSLSKVASFIRINITTLNI
jgi:hypothetical protein